MFFLMYLSTILILISSLLLSINLMISKKKMKNREKNSSFECGFDPMSNPRIPFSIQFFLISLMFLIFDIEITLLIPLVYSFFKFSYFMILTFLIFIIILILSLYIEINENMLEWKLSI